MPNLCLRRAADRPSLATHFRALAGAMLVVAVSAPTFAQGTTPTSPTTPPATPATPATPAAPATDNTVPAISTERPGYTNGTDIVPLHHLQLEMGVQREEVGGNGESEFLNASELRIPLSTDTEFRIGLPTYVFHPTGLYRGEGFTDSSISAKVKFLQEVPGKCPALAAIVGTTLPTGRPHVFRSDRSEPTLDLEGQMGFASVFQVQASLIGTRVRFANDTYTQGTGALGLAYNLTPTVSPFIQIERLTADTTAGNNATLADAGATWGLNDSLQLDASAGIGVSPGQQSYHFFSFGISKRW